MDKEELREQAQEGLSELFAHKLDSWECLKVAEALDALSLGQYGVAVQRVNQAHLPIEKRPDDWADLRTLDSETLRKEFDQVKQMPTQPHAWFR